jgi:putative endonuclease
MAYMYILECVDGSYYIGSTKDLKCRLWQHQQGLGANHTAKRLPVKLVFYEYYHLVADAFEREKQVQGWNRKKKQALIAGDTNLLHKLAECQNETHYLRLAGFDFAQPANNPPNPQNNPLNPQNNPLSPQNNSLSPQNNSLSPQNNSLSPQNNSLSPQNNSLSPQNNPPHPQNNPPHPQNNSLSPQNNPPHPQNNPP